MKFLTFPKTRLLRFFDRKFKKIAENPTAIITQKKPILVIADRENSFLRKIVMIRTDRKKRKKNQIPIIFDKL